ncbi:hypothetical protein LENED_002101 [Lentinula edodes]|uniref:Uncharacterized protein n=1 Tax=Lentinula edodes TaxID=5353 RepID=A0A1Q3E006_LENED|nr:hypothetical protein LENED_002101 [Lentinula edodes]
MEDYGGVQVGGCHCQCQSYKPPGLLRIPFLVVVGDTQSPAEAHSTKLLNLRVFDSFPVIQTKSICLVIGNQRLKNFPLNNVPQHFRQIQLNWLSKFPHNGSTIRLQRLSSVALDDPWVFPRTRKTKKLFTITPQCLIA